MEYDCSNADRLGNDAWIGAVFFVGKKRHSRFLSSPKGKKGALKTPPDMSMIACNHTNWECRQRSRPTLVSN